MIKFIKIIIFLVSLILALSIVAIFMLKEKSIEPTFQDDIIANNEVEDRRLDHKSEYFKSDDYLSYLLDEYIQKNNLNDTVSVSVTGFDDNVIYKFNSDKNFFAASIYKVPLAMVYYEKINDGELSLSSQLLYESYHFESGGPIGDNYTVGSYISLEKLLNYMIIYSDNTAAHILFENLGGWMSFKKEIAKYSDSKVDADFYSSENILTTEYMNDVIEHLYQNRGEYLILIKDMKNQVDFNFLSKYVDIEIAQKYGQYGNAINSVGIVFASHPYGIAIFTSAGELGVEHISKINEICYNFFIFYLIGKFFKGRK